MPAQQNTTAILTGSPPGEDRGEALQVKLLADAPIQWAQTPGTTPHQAAFEVPASAEAVLGRLKGRPVSLVVKVWNQAPQLRVDYLYVVGLVSSGRPQTRMVLVADRRWLWSRKVVHRNGYNMRRRTGDKRILQADELGNVASIDKIAFAPYSLNGDRPWRAREILADVMAEVEPDAQVVIPDFRNQLPIDSLTVSGNADDAIREVLRFIPGAGVYVANSGTVIFYDQLGKQEEIEAGKGSRITTLGWPVQVDNRHLRPSKVTVFFDREIEVRFDGGEDIALGGIVALENVVPIPDPTLVVGDGPEARTLAQGTYITVDEILAAWNKLPLPPGAPPYSKSMIHELWFSGAYPIYTDIGKQVDPAAPIYTIRIATLKAHYRQTWRIARKWMDRLLSFRAERVAIFDPGTGTRAASQAWSNYCVVPTDRGLVLTPGAGYLGVNIEGYATRLKGAQVCPIGIGVVNEEVGILRLDYRTDPQALLGEIIPSKVANVPTAYTGARRPRWWYEDFPSGAKGTDSPKLEHAHGVAVILTAAPASPNSTKALQKVEVQPQEAEALLREAGIDVKITPAEGPELQVRVYAGVTAARFCWWDVAEYVPRVERAFGVGGDPGPLDDTWQNREECIAVARAVAAVAYTNLTDRLQGQKGGPLNAQQHIAGSIESVTHTLPPNGEATTMISLPLTVAGQVNFLTLLPASVRRIVGRMIQP